jgi:hypothetical protein
MRGTASIILCLVAALLPMGCRTPSAQLQDNQTVVVEGGGKFPPALAGTWKADRDGWEFVIERNGRISSAVISLGRVRVTPGKSETLPTQGGGEGLFEPGPWTVYFNPQTNDLTVKIVMSHVRVGMAEAILEGASTDTFSGSISSADNVWQVQWTNFSYYQLQMPDGSSSELATDETYGETNPLTFERVPQP